MLGDSTRILFTLGAVEVNQSGQKRYLTFSPTDDSPASFFRTESILITGSSDSICYTSDINYEDKNYQQRFDKVTGSYHIPEGVFGFYDKIFFNPDEDIFASNSHIYFITKLVNSTDGGVVKILDTAKCYRNHSGKLVYRNYPSSLSQKIYRIGNIDIQDSVYLTVEMITDLPPRSKVIAYENSAFTREVYSFWKSLPSYYETVSMYQVYVGKNRRTDNDLHGNSMFIDQIEVERADMTSNSITVHYRSSAFGLTTLNVYNTKDDIVYSKDIYVMPGSSRITLQLPQLSPSAYKIGFQMDEFQSDRLLFVQR
jgi:hypothetical protein